MLKHGYSRVGKKTAEYKIWCGIKERCNNPHNHRYARYGGRGISVCERWAQDFEAFLSDMGPRPSSEHTIDRIDPDGNYAPENCRWATVKEQQRNRPDNVRVEMDGESLCLAEIAERYGLSRTLVWRRFHKGLRNADLVRKPRHGNQHARHS